MWGRRDTKEGEEGVDRMEVTEESAVLSWLNSFSLRSPVASLLDLTDGIVLQQVLVEISSDFAIDSLHYDTSNYVLKVTHSFTHLLTHSFIHLFKYALMFSFLLSYFLIEGDQSQNDTRNVANILQKVSK